MDSMHFLLDTWGNIKTPKAGLLELILPKAKQRDMSYIHEFGKVTKMNADERAEFARQMSKLNKKFGLTADGKPISAKNTE